MFGSVSRPTRLPHAGTSSPGPAEVQSSTWPGSSRLPITDQSREMGFGMDRLRDLPVVRTGDADPDRLFLGEEANQFDCREVASETR